MIHDELISYKVKLEELFSETDIKEQSIKIDFWCFHINFPILTALKEEQSNTLKVLIHVENLLSRGGSDDFERYAKMGLRIDPKNPYFLKRNGNYNSVLQVVTSVYI